jgi:hypothetical protein
MVNIVSGAGHHRGATAVGFLGVTSLAGLWRRGARLFQHRPSLLNFFVAYLHGRGSAQRAAVLHFKGWR